MAACLEAVRLCEPVRRWGRVAEVVGLGVEAVGPAAGVGEVCVCFPADGGPAVPAEVTGFRNGRVLLMPLGRLVGIAPGCRVLATGRRARAPRGEALVGRVLDGLGRPLDGSPLDPSVRLYEPPAGPPPPLERPPIDRVLPVGVRAIDALLTCGRGQRMGIFAGSGVGKSTLLAMLARGTRADVTVMALVGERGREVREFLDRDLGPEGLARSVVVVATSDQPPMLRVRAAFTATAIAEAFREEGKDVLLLFDSVTRFAMAQREVGLASGEPPATRGYPPSVFALLPQLLERAGTAARGSITAFYTVLVDGDDLNEPVADAMRGILDGHIVLSRALAARGQYPPIDVLQSVSRVMHRVVDRDHLAAARAARRLLATYRDAEDLIQVGAYREGSDPEIDRARAAVGPLRGFLAQSPEEVCPMEAAVAELRSIVDRFGGGT
ncbi:MAG: FliI/YscN family ATPase [Clostridia bacterium]|nr:FliI/YscN family ATPase [Clostridia bacterium]